ncbi:PD-(D/E)XK nuclease family protein [Patescibacteria group bacterium]|nr:PD-(D/E)XK nuclease family protein [Patescibacteria group bacterium]MBU1906612.1 PD-(D/E)XK nuclease family protein [Patescibacteria group bacterium]
MSQYYNVPRTRNLYVSGKPFKVSRSKIDLFLECPKCFWLDRVKGIGRPPGFPFNLNSAVDFLLKKEFDIHRAKQKAHPMMKAYGLKAVPFDHQKIDEWRENFVGVQVKHEPTGLTIFGAVDDIWIDVSGDLIVVDYKATSKDGQVNLDADWQIGYKRQMEVYQWLLRNNGFNVSDTGYFVYCNGRRDAEAFDGKLEFDVTLLPYVGNGKWIEGTLIKLHKCLNKKTVPASDPNCDYCRYRDAVEKI